MSLVWMILGSGSFCAVPIPKMVVAEAEMVETFLESWGIKGQVCALVFDTTNSNTGIKSGVFRGLA